MASPSCSPCTGTRRRRSPDKDLLELLQALQRQLPAAMRPTPRKTSGMVTSPLEADGERWNRSKSQQPGDVEPEQRHRAGRIVWSQSDQHHHPVEEVAPAPTSSMESAITSRLTKGRINTLGTHGHAVADGDGVGKSIGHDRRGPPRGFLPSPLGQPAQVEVAGMSPSRSRRRRRGAARDRIGEGADLQQERGRERGPVLR